LSSKLPLTLALASTGDPEDRTVSSAVPAVLMRALGEVAERMVPISDAPRGREGRIALALGGVRGLRPGDLLAPAQAKAHMRIAGQCSGAFTAARARNVQRRLAACGHLDGLIQMGADYPAPGGIPMVTRQDSTVLQALKAYSWPHLQGLTAGQIAGMVERQRRTYESTRGCCGATHWVAESIVGEYRIPREKVHVIGTAPNHIVPAALTAGRDWSAPRFLFVGTAWERKNGPATLAAFAEVRRSHPSARLDIVSEHPRIDVEGAVGHGKLAFDDLEQCARLMRLYAEATVFVMPSVHEPAGAVYLEAARAGIASIGTRNGGAATLIGDAGCVVDPRDRRELTEAMLRLCDPGLAQELGALAEARSQLFTWRKVAERIVRALHPPGVDLSGFADFL
jgi:hypothetical protein